ncbi:homospermidine synthase [Sulfurivermis fontis]|uniref:homospermidine synthase n=1 Tax=Sulfurivermis fontis TaxID=1972068 RepID=UPI000FDC8131|nr:saccharopine dehydrogenase C-terminal domain-containing protein [Sulfurivermis fontis]
MAEHRHYVQFSGRLLLLGFGAIGRGVLPLLLRHIGLRPEQITVLRAHDNGDDVARSYGVTQYVEPLRPDNYRAILARHVGAGDFVLNLSVNVSSLALIEYCQEHGILYLDACIEPWEGGHFDTRLTPAQRSNYAYREAALALRQRYGAGPTAVINHGVNPGLVSHFLKQALLNLAADHGMTATPMTREEWARLAHGLGVRTIHIAERDSQYGQRQKRRGEFVNTWSCEAFVDESCQPAELGWGTHERHWPAAARRYGFGRDCAIYLERPGAAVRVRSWTPGEGNYHGFLISHGESISIADYLSLHEGGQVSYRPTVHYAYHPCDDAVQSLHELAGKNWHMQPRQRLLLEDIVEGIDELGVLVMGPRRGAYWYGSQLSNVEARALVPYNSATTLQVTAGVLAGVVWVMRHPARGITEPDAMDYAEVLDIARPYLGPMVGRYTDWTPLEGRGRLFEENIDRSDPWQFCNFLVE